MVAAGTIASGKRIVPSDVKKTLSIYDRYAALELKEVEGRRALVAMQEGDVLLRDKLSTTSLDKISVRPDVRQVVVSAADLLPFHPISSGELITLREITGRDSNITAMVPGVFTEIDEVIHRYPLRPIAKDTVLEQSQLGPIQLEPVDSVDLANCQILALRIEKGAYSTAAIPPKRVTLVFSPKDRSSNQGALKVHDVLILDVKLEADGTAEFVFAATIDLAQVAPVLGNSAVFVIQSAGPHK